MDLDLNQLRAFHAVARTGSYTRAAQRLHVTQSAVSHAMRKLEDSVGRPLVKRRGRGITLTAEGRTLQETCERVFAELERAQAKLGEEPAVRERIVLGATVEFGTTVLVSQLAGFQRAHPELHLDLHLSHHLVQPLLRDEIDLAVDCRPHPHPSVASEELFRERYSVIVSPAFLAEHPIAGPRGLEDLPVLSMDEEAEWWSNVLRALPPGERPSLRRLVCINHVRGIINATIAGMGVGLVPSYTVLDELEDGRLLALFPELELLEDRFRLSYKHHRRHEPAIQSLAAFLRELDVAALGGAILRPGA